MGKYKSVTDNKNIDNKFAQQIKINRIQSKRQVSFFRNPRFLVRVANLGFGIFDKNELKGKLWEKLVLV